jgi:predicted nucleic acid-binding protein
LNLFLDTSALVKLYIDEPDSDYVQNAVLESSVVALSQIAYVEFYSAMARRKRDKLVTARESRIASTRFEQEWLHYGKVLLRSAVLATARQILMKHSLRALDAIQLSSAIIFRSESEEPVHFLSLDRRLTKAAIQEKFALYS